MSEFSEGKQLENPQRTEDPSEMGFFTTVRENLCALYVLNALNIVWDEVAPSGTTLYFHVYFYMYLYYVHFV